MSINVFNIKRNDLQPYYRFKIVDTTGEGIDCTGYTAYFTMSNGTELIIDKSECTWVDETVGEGVYKWSGTDTANVGTFNIEIEVTPIADPTLGKFTVPVTEKAKVKIWPDLDEG